MSNKSLTKVIIENSQTEKVTTFVIVDMIGNKNEYQSTSIKDLRCQLASWLNTWAPCVTLLEDDHEVLDEDWGRYQLHTSSVTFTAINNTRLRESMAEWTDLEWYKQLNKWLTCKYWSILDIIDQVATIEVSNIVKKKALQNALRQDHHEIVANLMDHGVSLHKDQVGQSLVLASMNGHQNIVRVLLDLGSDIAQEYIGRALTTASAHGKKEIVLLLLNQGLDVNGGYIGQALVDASVYGHAEIVSLLLDWETDIKRDYLKIAYSNASIRGHTKIVSLLID